MQSNQPKQHIVMGKKQIIEYTLTAFSESEMVDAILVVSNVEYIADIANMKCYFPKLQWIIEGGSTRIDSVANAVKFLNGICAQKDKVVFSDAVRPCVTLREIRELFELLDSYGAVTTGVEVYETLLKIEGDSLAEIVPRDGMVRQTSPEGYMYSLLYELYMKRTAEQISAYKNIGIDQLFATGMKIGLVKSSSLNFKITTPEDLILFDSVLKQGFKKIIRCEN